LPGRETGCKSGDGPALFVYPEAMKSGLALLTLLLSGCFVSELPVSDGAQTVLEFSEIGAYHDDVPSTDDLRLSVGLALYQGQYWITAGKGEGPLQAHDRFCTGGTHCGRVAQSAARIQMV
jgi:hypothetical protein